MYRTITIELSGKCNALCNWCYTGRKNRYENISDEGTFMSTDSFNKIIEYIQNTDWVGKETIFDLYLWGEPFLNPYIEDIFTVLDRKGYKFRLSTNASIIPKISKPNILRNLKELYISMPGFSQSSYDRIHGFSFDKIISNIPKLLSIVNKCGFKGQVGISYHIYQFNINEMIYAKEFALLHNMEIYPYYAYLAGMNMFLGYMENSLDYNILKNASQELMLFYYDDISKNRPIDYNCPQMYDNIIIDENLNVLTCALNVKTMENYSIAKLLDLLPEEISKLKKIQPICDRCQKHAIDYIVHNTSDADTPDTMSIIENDCNDSPILDIDGYPLKFLYNIDNPSDREEILINNLYNIKGWVLHGSGISVISAFLNNEYIGRATYGDIRPDVYDAFSDYNNSSAGFHFKWLPNEIAEGNHMLSFLFVTKDGNKFFTEPTNITIKES